MMTDTHTYERRGFSLIEVLIAVLVLAIGMLGLGAVFPAIIAEQRDSFAAIEGENAAASAAALLQNPELVDFSFVDESFGKYADSSAYRYEHLWSVQDFSSNPYDLDDGTIHRPGIYFDTGLWTFDFDGDLFNGASGNPPATDVYVSQIPLSARLYPQPYSGKEPKMVWDIALRREPKGNQLQAAIFVRRIDARIRVPRDNTLSDVLTGGGNISAARTRLPVAITGATGLPAADDGSVDHYYAVIQALKVEVHPERLDWLVFPDGRDGSVDTSIDLATQIGQKLVDNTGTVRTVVGIAEAGPSDPLLGLLSSARVVVVDPPFLPSNAGGADTDRVYPGGSNSQDKEWDDERASWVRQVIFTPREPVAVKIVTLGGAS